MEIRVQAGPTGISPEGFMIAWSLNVLGLLARVTAGLERSHRAVALDLVEAWGLTLREMLSQPGTEVHTYDGEAVGTLRTVFQRGCDLTERVSACCGEGVPAVSKARTYFAAELVDLERWSGIGEVYCEHWVFEQVNWHLKDLLAATLGEVRSRMFGEGYDAITARLREDDGLARAPVS